MATYGQLALNVAARELGTKESPAGSNWGPPSKYIKPLGHGPEPWCADFGEYTLEQVGWKRPAFNVSYCPSWVNEARKGTAGMRVLGPTEPFQPGDVALYDWGHDGIADHFGLIEKVLGPGQWTAIEGNTSVGNDSNGGEVMRRTRDRRDTAAIVRLPVAPGRTLAQRARAAGYGAKTVAVALRNLKAGISGSVPNPSDREMFQHLRREGLSADSARKFIKSIRRNK